MRRLPGRRLRRCRSARAAIGAAALISAWAALPAPAGAVPPEDVRALQAKACPRFVALADEYTFTPDALEAARTGVYTVFGRTVRLVPPVDWARPRFGSRQWRLQLNAFWWIEPLIDMYIEDGDRAMLRQARDLMLDWIDANPYRRDPSFAWKPLQSAHRALYFAYLTRAAACEGMLGQSKARKILQSLAEHGDFLASGLAYTRSNRGVVMDAALIVLRDFYLPFLDGRRYWRNVGRNRLADVLPEQVQRKEGVHLEHSPGYHMMVTRLLRKLLQAVGGDRDLVRLVTRMEEATQWFVMPDGMLTQFGDTDLEPQPGWSAQRASTLDQNLSPTRRSGYAIVKTPQSYLAVSAGYHNVSHKQADDLTFDLYEDGERIVSDTGKWGYETDSQRDFATSSRAHSTLTVDGRDFLPGDKEGARSRELMYGSGIQAKGRGSGWYAIQARNGLLKKLQGVSHSRLFLYQPGTALIVADLVDAGGSHDYRRYFHFGPGLEANAGARTLRLSGREFEGTLYDDDTRAERTRSLLEGERDPLQGWVYPSRWENPLPRETVRYRSRGRDVKHVASFGLDGSVLKSSIQSVSGNAIKVRVRPAAGGAYTLKAVLDGHQLEVNEQEG